jgi:nucleoside-diphosphate-sugar epimerase
LPTLESAEPNCLSPYALTKLIGEQYCKLYEKIYGLQANYIRPFNVFGARQNPEGGYAAAVCKFMDMLSNNKTPYITGDGEQTRDFIYVDNLVDLMLLAAESEVYGEAFNGGSETNISINNLYKTICKLMNKDMKPDYVDKVFEPRVTLSDMSKAKKLLGWKCRIGLEEGLKLML